MVRYDQNDRKIDAESIRRKSKMKIKKTETHHEIICNFCEKRCGERKEYARGCELFEALQKLCDMLADPDFDPDWEKNTREEIPFRGKLKIEIVRIPKVLGGGYEARIPKLGKATYRAWGTTKKEAIRNLKSTWRDIMKSVERLKK